MDGQIMRLSLGLKINKILIWVIKIFKGAFAKYITNLI